MIRKALLVGLAVLLVGAACSSDDDGGDRAADTTAPAEATTTAPPVETPVPAVEGPIEGGERGVPANPLPPEIAEEYGYVEEEYFISGDATAYTAGSDLAADGQWTLEPGETAPYETRLIVRRPEDPDEANGIVVVEWLNVSAGRDSDPDFGFLYPVLLEEGYTYLGVSAQATGVVGGGAALEVPGVPAEALLPLTEWDAERYGGLAHPGDEYSYDIYSQVAQLVRDESGSGLLGGVEPTTVVAIGESQSAGRLAAYVNGVHPLVRRYDAILIHSRGDGATDFGDATAAPPDVVTIRTDLEEPVFQVETETDVEPSGLGFFPARQDDTDLIRTWEIAGTSHADVSQLDYGAASGAVWLPGVEIDFSQECGSINDGPQPQVVRAAFDHLVRWAEGGEAPPEGEPLETDAAGSIQRDDVGNAVGGIRTPDVDAPSSSLTGITPAESVFCSLFGASEPLTDAQLADLYEDHDAYVEAVTASANEAFEGGFILAADRDAFIAEAEESDVGSG